MEKTEERDIYSNEDWTDEEVQAYLAAAGKGYIDSIHIERSNVSHWGLTKDGYRKAPISRRCTILLGFQHDVPQIRVSAPLVKQATKQVLVMLEKKIEQLENILIKKGKLPPRGSEDAHDDGQKLAEDGSGSDDDKQRTRLAGDGGDHAGGTQGNTQEASPSEGTVDGAEGSGSDDDPAGCDVHPGEDN